MRRWARASVAAALAIAWIACDEPLPEEPLPSAPPPAVAPELGDEEPPPSSWPSDVEDLAASLESFTTVEACVVSLRAGTPTSIAEGLADLEYDAFFDDVCRAMAAVHDRSAEGCDAIEVSSVRRGCRRRLAIVAGDPALCPDDRVIEGRDPVCVAWAARDPALCRAAPADERTSCEAVLARDPGRCARSIDRARCEAWSRRYAGALGDARHESAGPREEPAMRLELERHVPGAGGEDRVEGEPIVIELGDAIARGVRLSPEGCTLRAVLDSRGTRGAIVGRSGARGELPIGPGEAPLAIPIGPGGASLEVAHSTVGRRHAREGTITLTHVGRARGAPLAGTIEATIDSAPGEWRVRGEFRTFVRDLDDLPGACAGDRMPPP